MALVLQDGTNPTGANAYANRSMASTYVIDRALTFSGTNEALDAALIRGTEAIDGMFGARFPGWRTFLREQLTAWPRTDAYDSEDNLIDTDEIPVEVINASIEAAVRELATPGSMQPDLARGGAIKRVKAGSVEVEYADAADVTTTWSKIEQMLAPILGATVFAGSARTARV
jgi:hypothetical protein